MVQPKDEYGTRRKKRGNEKGGTKTIKLSTIK